MTTPKNISTLHPSKFQLVFPFLDFLGNDEKGDDVILFCSEVQLPGITMDTTITETPYFDMKNPTNKITYDDLIVTYSVDELLTNYKLLLSWLNYIKDPERYEVRNQRVDASLFIYTNNDNPKSEIYFKDMFPIAIEPLTFDHRVEDSEDLENTITFAIESFKVR